MSERSEDGAGRRGSGVPDLVLGTVTPVFPPKALDARGSPGKSDSRQGANRAGWSALGGRQVGSKDAQPLTSFIPPLDRARQQRTLFS